MIYINGRFLTQKLTGVQRFAFEMVKGLLLAQTESICILTPPQSIDESYDILGWPVKAIGKRTNALWEQIDLPLFLRSIQKPLLVNLVNTAPAFYKNQIVSILDMTTFINSKWFDYKFVYYYRMVVPLIAKNSQKIITISENSKSDIIRFLNTRPDKIEVLYCGIGDQFFNKASDVDSNNKLLIKLHLTAANYVLAVSSLDPRKNFKKLIEAYNLSKLTIPLVIVGSEGKVFADNGIKQLVVGQKNIIFTGYVSDAELINLYKSARLFIYPSLYEGFGMPPLEAMACGCPTIVSNTSSMPEVCGDASVYVDPENIESIKDAIVKVANDSELRSKLMDAGIIQVKKFSWKNSSLKLKNVINSISK